MKQFGFVRVGAISNQLFLASPIRNAHEILKMVQKADSCGIDIVTTPELSLTGYTCGDLFFHDNLLSCVESAIRYLLENSKNMDIIFIVGAPIRHDNQLFNVAIVIQKGKILGMVPKTYIPNYAEFYEQRWFSSSEDLINKEISFLGFHVAIDTNLLFVDKRFKEISFSLEICEDLWAVNPPSNYHCLHGATIIFNLSSSNEIVGKDEYRRKLVSMQSGKAICAYVYASSGMMESSSDLLFGGSCLIFENGTCLSSNERFLLDSTLIYADVDVKRLTHDRAKNTSYMNFRISSLYRVISIDIKDKGQQLERTYSPYPFVPIDVDKKDERCREILNIQASALARRLIQLHFPKCVIGISGGLDSTLAFLVIEKAYEKLQLDMKNVIAVTMPGFGTSNRTYANACLLIKEYGASFLEVDIKKACLLHMKDIGLKSQNRSVTFENIQARERMQILMDIANKENGIVIGTGDLSELALGWCTYNGDHMSMYSVNSSIPKTLVKYLVRFVADHSSSNKKKIIYDILDTPISPELLPLDKKGKILQKTESNIGPYMLHDFFLYHFLRYGASPKKIYFLAKNTFSSNFSSSEIKKWLIVFIKRFFTSQFKRNCVPDGIKVGSVSLSPRGDLRFPSDADYESFIEELENLE